MLKVVCTFLRQQQQQQQQHRCNTWKQWSIQLIMDARTWAERRYSCLLSRH